MTGTPVTQSQPIQNSHDKAILNWLDARQNLLVIFTRLCQMKPKSMNPISTQMLNDFIEQLVDYVSAGHFDIFEKIASSSQGKQFDNRVFIKILQNTNQSLDFSDRYAHIDTYQNLCDDLSALGEQLEERFAHEDKLIALYHQSMSELGL